MDRITVGQWCSGKWMHWWHGRNHRWAMVLWKVDALVAWTESSLGNGALESGCTCSVDGIIVGQRCSGKWMHWWHGRNHRWAMVLWKVDALVAWTQSLLGNGALESGCTGSMDGIIVGQWCSGSGCTGSMDRITVGQWCSGKWMRWWHGRNHRWAMVLWKVDALVAWTESLLGKGALESGCTGSMDRITVGQWCSGK